MAAFLRTTSGIAVGLIVLYWLFVLLARHMLGVELPDPAGLLPSGWRDHLPRWLAPSRFPPTKKAGPKAGWKFVGRTRRGCGGARPSKML